MSSMYSQERDRAFSSIDDNVKFLTGLTTPNIDVEYWWLVQPSTDVKKRERASLPWHPKGGEQDHAFHGRPKKESGGPFHKRRLSLDVH